jgi:hypothetical protein
MAAVSNLGIDQGTTFSVTFTVNDDTGVARNLSAYTARSQMRRSYFTTSNTAFTVSITNPTEGEIILELSAVQTASLKPGRYVYDLELVSNATTVERIVEGIVTVFPEATK